MSPELEKYRASVRMMAESKSTLVFPNDGPEHACIVSCELFNTSSKEVNIFTRSMSGVFASKEGYLEAMTSFIDRGGKVNIMVSDSSILESGNSAFFNILQNKYPNYVDLIEIKKCTLDKPLYFMIGDDDKYRIQLDEKYKALVCFNDSERTKKLLGFYKGWYSESVSLKGKIPHSKGN